MGVRLILAAVVVVGATLCGKALSDRARLRAKLLSQLAEDVRLLRVHMVSMFEPVADSLSRAASPILTRVGEGMGGGASAMEAWEALKKDRRFIAGTGHALLKEDREALSALFARLGESGRESQDALLTGAAERLASLAQSAGERADAAEKLYVTLGFLTGLLLAIIVI